MSLWKTWKEQGAVWGIWKVEEQWSGLRKLLTSSSIPYDQELQVMKAESRKLEYVAVRVLLAVLCGEEKQIQYLPSGKPCLRDGSFHISISHTKGYVFVGLHPEREIGVDIEYQSERVKKITSRFLRDDEYAPSLSMLLLHWSAKETIYKMLWQNEVDFLQHLRILPFSLQQEGQFKGKEYRTPVGRSFDMRYMVSEDFVCTWSVAR